MESSLSKQELEHISNSAECLDLDEIAYDGDVDIDRLMATMARIALDEMD